MSPLPMSEEELRKLRHDLRSPLLVISGFAQLLAGDRDVSPDERREFATRIQRAADELKKMLDERVA